jgi:hypothetical protein
MQRYFTHYWLNQTWERNRIYNSDGDRLNHIAGNLFQERGVRVGDMVYVVTVIKGSLYVCDKLIVGKICDVGEAAAILDCEPEELWEANEHVISSAATPSGFQSQSTIESNAAVEIFKGRLNKDTKI